MKKLTLQNIGRRSLLIAVVIVVAGIGTAFRVFSHADSGASLSLTPASGVIGLGATFQVAIVENSATTQVNAFEADLSYDQSKLQFVSIDTSASPFTLGAHSTGGNGSVSLASGVQTPVEGSQTVGLVTFKALAAGSTDIDFLASSGIASASDNSDVLGTKTGATYTIKDETAPSVPGGVTATAHTATSISFSWTAASDNVAVQGYNVYRGGTKIGTTTTTTYTDSGLTPSNSYAYAVAAYDAAGNVSTVSPATAISTGPDATAPSIPTAVTGGTKTLTSISFSWTASTDNVGVTGYKVYRDGTQVGTSSDTNYTSNDLKPGSSYSFSVAAYDAAGNTSSQTAASNFTTLADTSAPGAPTGLTSSAQTTTSIILSWTAPSDNVGVTGYKVYRDGTQVGTSTTAGYTDSGLTVGKTYSYTVAAYDGAGNVSSQSTAKSVTTLKVAGDANGDGVVNYLDLSILAASWHSTTDLRADFNHDGQITYLDLSILAAHWGQ